MCTTFAVLYHVWSMQILGCLQFVERMYGLFNFQFRFLLSTRYVPESSRDTLSREVPARLSPRELFFLL